MLTSVPSLLAQVGAVAGLSVGAVLSRRKGNAEPEASAFPRFVKSPFHALVRDLRQLEQPEQLAQFIQIADRMLRTQDAYMAGHESGSAQFLLNRQAHELETLLRQMLEAAKKTRHIPAIDMAVITEQEHLPFVQSTCNNMLHNMLLK